MAKITKMPPPAKTVIHRPQDATKAFALAENCIVAANNDTPIRLIGAQVPEFYAVKVQGESIVHRIDDVAGGLRGAVYYEYPDATDSLRNRKFFATPDDKIYMMKGASLIEVRDCSVDGYTIDRLVGYQTKDYLYMTIGDPDMDSALYVYDYKKQYEITSIVDVGGTKLEVFAPDHGLQTGQTILVEGADTAVYNGTYEITYTDINHFKINAAYSVPMTGTWEADVIYKKKMTGLEATSIVTGGDSRITTAGCGSNKGTAQYSELDIGGVFNDFTSGTAALEGGVLSGNMISIVAMQYYKNLSFVFEKTRISVHRVGDTTVDELVVVKDNDTLESAYTIEGNGTSSLYGTCIGRGQLFYADEVAGVFSYSSSGAKDSAKVMGRELSLPIHDELLKNYSLSRAALGYHPGFDVLMVAASSVAGGENNVVFYYNFQTKTWSIDTTKFVRQFIWDNAEGQMYAISSIIPAISKIFDGGYSTYLRQPITMIVQEHYFDGGRRSQLKEYVDSSVIIGVSSQNTSMKYSLFVDSEDVSQADTIVDLREVNSIGREVGPMGSAGETTFGMGFSEELSNLNYVQYYNDEFIDDHRRVSVRIEETSAAPFVVYPPEVVVEVLADETDDDF